MQIAVMTARIAKGTAILPRLINAKGGKIIPILKPSPLPFKERFLEKVRDGMTATVNDVDGTAYNSRITNPKFQFAGKTGTAQVRRITEIEREEGVTKNEELPWEKRDHALFTGYAPTNNPKYAISVIVEHGGGGSAVAAPIARDIMLYALHDSLPSILSYPEDQRSEIKLRLEKLKNLNKSNSKNGERKGQGTQT